MAGYDATYGADSAAARGPYYIARSTAARDLADSDDEAAYVLDLKTALTAFRAARAPVDGTTKRGRKSFRRVLATSAGHGSL